MTDFKILKLGGTIKVNNGPVETLIKTEGGYGLFKSTTGYNVVRRIPIHQSEILTAEPEVKQTNWTLF